jgi:hypothetical protein
MAWFTAAALERIGAVKDPDTDHTRATLRRVETER